MPYKNAHVIKACAKPKLIKVRTQEKIHPGQIDSKLLFSTTCMWVLKVGNPQSWQGRPSGVPFKATKRLGPVEAKPLQPLVWAWKTLCFCKPTKNDNHKPKKLKHAGSQEPPLAIHRATHVLHARRSFMPQLHHGQVSISPAIGGQLGVPAPCFFPWGDLTCAS